MITADQLREAIVNATVFDRRDNVGHEVGRAAETSQTLKAAARLLANAPLTLAALQAGAEERPPDYLAGQRFANRGDSGDWGLSDFDLVEVKGIIEAAIGDGAVVLVPRSE